MAAIDAPLFALPRAEIEIVDTWHSLGLKGSASGGVVVSGVFVPSIARSRSGSSRAGRRRAMRSTEGRALSHAGLLHLRGLHQTRLFFWDRRGGAGTLPRTARAARMALTSGQKVGGYPTQQVKVAEASATPSPRRPRQLLFAVCDEAARHRRARRPAGQRAACEFRSQPPPSPASSRAAPSSCCRMPAHAGWRSTKGQSDVAPGEPAT